MDRTLFRTTAMVGLILSAGITAAAAGQGHHGGMGAPFRPMMGMHAGGMHQGFGGGYRGTPPVSGMVRAQPTVTYGGGQYAGGGYRPGGGYGQGGYGQFGSRQGGYAHGPAIYSMQRQGYGAAVQRPAYGGYRNGGTAYGGGRQQFAGMRVDGRGERYGYRQGRRYGAGYGYGGGRRYGYGGAAIGAVAGAAAGYAVGSSYGGGYGGSYGGGYYSGGYGGDVGSSYAGTGYDAGYAAPETPLTVTYGEPALQPSDTGGLFGTGGYALDGQVQDVGYGGPTVGGYGFGGASGWSQGIAPAGGLAVYSPGAYGPGPRVITIPSQYRTGSPLGCTCGTAGGY